MSESDSFWAVAFSVVIVGVLRLAFRYFYPDVDPNVDPNVEPDVDPDVDPNVEPDVDPNVETEKKYSAPLDDRMKEYEKEFTSQKIDSSLPIVMRLDGHAFSQYTRGLHKPYDYNFQQIFAETTKELMKEYRADLGYTHSDEISLLFYPKRTKNDDDWREPHFGGRIQKMITTAAGFCTMKFNQIGRELYADKKEEYIMSADEPVREVYNRIMEGKAYFDCRIFQLPNDPEMFSYLFWRSQVDCRRNHVFELARSHFTKSELHGKGTKERIAMLSSKGVDWTKEPACFRRGSFFKRARKVIPTQPDLVRFEYTEVDVELTKFDDQINELLKSEIKE